MGRVGILLKEYPQLAIFLTSPGTSMTKLKRKFHSRYLCAQDDTPQQKASRSPCDLQLFERGQEILGSQKKLFLTLPAPSLPLSLYQDRAEGFPNPQFPASKFHPDHPRKISLHRPSHQLILPSTTFYSGPPLFFFSSALLLFSAT